MKQDGGEEISSSDDVTRNMKIVRPETRIKAIEFIKNLFCIACSYNSDCSSRYPEYLIKCRYLEEWALNKYKEHIESRD